MFHTIYFPMYEAIKHHYRTNLGLQEGSFALYGCASATAGALCNVLSNPFWMVRTRMQAEIFRSACEENYRSKYPLNIFKAMKHIIKQEGFFALY
jgi:solute carrier family 25 (mitochondrial folate transporter), member 32